MPTAFGVAFFYDCSRNLAIDNSNCVVHILVAVECCRVIQSSCIASCGGFIPHGGMMSLYFLSCGDCGKMNCETKFFNSQRDTNDDSKVSPYIVPEFQHRMMPHHCQLDL